MDRLQEAIRELATRCAEVELDAAERSVGQLVRREVAHLLELEGARAARAAMQGACNDGLVATPDGGLGAPIAATVDIATGRVSNIECARGGIWEASLLMGLPCTGFGGSVAIAIALILNALVQAFVLIVVHVGRPLPSNADDAAAFSSSEPAADAAGVLHVHLPLLKAVAMVAWTLTMACEVRRNLTHGLRIAAIPRHATEVVKTDGMYVLVSIMPLRLWFASFLGALRMGVAATLLIGGARRVSAASSPAELRGPRC